MTMLRRERLQPGPRKLLDLLDVAATPRDRAYIAVGINTALRSNEMLRIRVRDIDLAAGSLFVTISKTNEEDVLPVSADLDVELRRWLVTYQKDLGRRLDSDDFLFPARRGGRYQWHRKSDGTQERTRTPPSWAPDRPMTHAARVVQEALAAVGLPTRGEGSHTLRRGVARAMFDDLTTEVGYDAALRTVSALLHHKSAATTEHYLGLSSERQRRDEALRGKPFLSRMVDRDANVLPLRPTQQPS